MRRETKTWEQKKLFFAPSANLFQYKLRHGPGAVASEIAVHPHGARSSRSVPQQKDHQQAGLSDTGLDSQTILPLKSLVIFI